MIGVSHIGIAAHRGGGGTIPPDLRFISTWDTTKTSSGSSTSTQVKLPLTSNGTYNFTVEWGDGNSDTITAYNQAAVTHTYATSGVYQIIIDGTIIGFDFSYNNNPTGDRLKLFDVSNWGTLTLKQASGLISGKWFYNCTNFNFTATDAPTIQGTNIVEGFRGCTALTTPDMSKWNISAITNLSGAFLSCTNFNADISSWDVSNVTNLSNTFNGCTKFNQNIGAWNVSNTTNFNNTFKSCTLFNVDISGWDVSSATNMSGMFASATAFNQNITGWDVSSVQLFGGGNYDQGMFSATVAFQQEIGVWNVSAATDMRAMFWNSTFDKDISAWDINQVTAFNAGVYGFHSSKAFSTANYDAILVGWAAQIPLTATAINFGTSKYTLGSAADTARASLISSGVTITDGGGI